MGTCIVQSLECDRCHRIIELPREVTMEDAEKALAEYKVSIDTTILDVPLKFQHLCKTCKLRVKNLILEVASRYDEVVPIRARKVTKKMKEAKKVEKVAEVAEVAEVTKIK